MAFLGSLEIFKSYLRCFINYLIFVQMVAGKQIIGLQGSIVVLLLYQRLTVIHLNLMLKWIVLIKIIIYSHYQKRKFKLSLWRRPLCIHSNKQPDLTAYYISFDIIKDIMHFLQLPFLMSNTIAGITENILLMLSSCQLLSQVFGCVMTRL